LENVEKLSRCGGLAEAVALQREWFDAAAKRLTAEFEKLAGRATSLSCEAASASRDAMQSVAEAATSKRTAKVKTAGPKKAGHAKTKAASMAKTDSAGEAIETAGEVNTGAAGEAIDAAGEAKVGQLETPTASEVAAWRVR
jgi:hypothetical protein